MLAWSDKKSDEMPSSKMFMRLFRYILGVNQNNEEIEMTRPVTSKVIPSKKTQIIDEEMCFWLGTPYQSKNAPNPIDKKVYIKERPEMVVYVKQFDGYALR